MASTATTRRCKRCGGPLNWGSVFCTRRCANRWRREHRPESFFRLEQTAAAKVDKLSLVRAAALLHVDRSILRWRIDRGDIRAEKVPRADGQGFLYFIDPLSLQEDVAHFICREPDCEELGLGPSGYCQPHAHVAATSGKPRSDEDRAKISVAKRGKPQPGVSAAKRARLADPVARDCLIGQLSAGQERRREHDWAVIEAERVRRKSLLIPEVAEQLGRSVAHVRERYIGRGLIEATRQRAGGVQVLLVSPDSLKRFRRAWPSGGDGRRKVWSEHDHYISWAIGQGRLQVLTAAGLSEIQAVRALEEEAKEHRRLFRNLGGRPEQTERKARWTDIASQVLDRELKLTPFGLQTLSELIDRVVEIDRAICPDDWPQEKYGRAGGWLEHRLVKKARQRVYEAVGDELKDLLAFYQKRQRPERKPLSAVS